MLPPGGHSEVGEVATFALELAAVLVQIRDPCLGTGVALPWGINPFGTLAP